jgi:hypothetical protein
MKKLITNTPSAELVEGYLTEIARGFGLQLNSGPRPVSDGQHSDVQALVVSDLDLSSIICGLFDSLMLLITRT